MPKNDNLDASKYRWTEWMGADRTGAFDFLKHNQLPVAVKDITFDERTFEKTDRVRNGVHLDFYGTGSVNEYAAVLCEDGTILFCIVSGQAFSDSVSSADRIEMKYYKLAEL